MQYINDGGTLAVPFNLVPIPQWFYTFGKNLIERVKTRRWDRNNARSGETVSSSAPHASTASAAQEMTTVRRNKAFAVPPNTLPINPLVLVYTKIIENIILKEIKLKKWLGSYFTGLFFLPQ
jgi:hypothetical protein